MRNMLCERVFVFEAGNVLTLEFSYLVVEDFFACHSKQESQIELELRGQEECLTGELEGFLENLLSLFKLSLYDH